MKRLYLRLTTIIILTCSLLPAWPMTKLDAVNQKIIADFRQQYLTKQQIQEKLVEQYIHDKNKVKQG